MRSLSGLCIIVFMLCLLPLKAQNNPAKPASVDERLASDSIKSVWIESVVAFEKRILCNSCKYKFGD